MRFKQLFTSVFSAFGKRLDFFVVIITISLSCATFMGLYQSGLYLADYDSIARLNIARRVTDSISPGLGQLGGVWLPLPQALLIPFVMNDYLWHSGLPASALSMLSFCIASYLCFKLVLAVSGSRMGALLAWLIFVSNVNLLYYQATAMSESFFLLTVVGSLYCFLLWTRKGVVLDLLATAAFLVLSTLTRYEGYFVLAAITLCIGISLLHQYGFRNWRRIEGTLILYSTLAFFGVFLWILYSALIFDDPLNFLNLYSGTKEVVAGQVITGSSTHLLTNATYVRTIGESFYIYGWATLLINGVLISIFGLASIAILFVSGLFQIWTRKKVGFELLLVIGFVVVFLFLIIGYKQGLIPKIEVPLMNMSTVLAKKSNLASHSNIRYGLLVLPFIAIFAGLFAAKHRVVMLTGYLVLIISIVTLVKTPYFFLFQIPKVLDYNISAYAEWMKEHYDGGYILVSANRHEPFMFQSNLPYKTFIYEGSRHYWTQSLENPARYATWVVYDRALEGDALKDSILHPEILEESFDVVYENKTLVILHIKDKPEDVVIPF